MAIAANARRYCQLRLIPLFLAGTLGAQAEVLPTGASTPLQGNIEIGADLGQVRGTNLFQSFSVFNILAGESAVFTGPDGIRNVIARVTGGTSDITGFKASLIDGPLVVAIQGANFFFINPNGVIFAENGAIDASGSVHVGTADVVRLADGGAFHADPARESVLTTAAPAAFGFLGANPAPIELNGPWLGAPYSTAPVPPGKTFALIGGDISIQAGAYGGAAIVAPGATVSLASVAASGDVDLTGLGQGGPDLSGFATLGQTRISGGSFIDVGDPGAWDDAGHFLGFVDNGASGAIFIRAGQLSLTPAGLLAQTGGDVDGGAIDIAVRGDMEAATDPESGIVSAILAGSYGGLGGGASIHLAVGGTLRISDASFVKSESYGPGAAGAIHIQAGDIRIQGQGLGEFTGISADNYDIATGPSLSIDSGGLTLLDGGYVGTRNFGAGNGGMLDIHADSILATGTGAVTLSLSTETVGGAAGTLNITTRGLELRDGARISSSTGGFGNAGDLNIIASERIDIDGEHSGIFSATTGMDAEVGDAGNAGALNLTTPLLRVLGGVIDSTTIGDGDAGAISVGNGQHDADVQLGAGGQIRSFSGGYDETNQGALVVGGGAAGTVSINARDNIDQIPRGGRISISGASASGSPSGLLAETRGAGAGGDVNVYGRELRLSDAGTISSSSLGGGSAGNVRIELGDSLSLRGGSIATRAVTSDGGNITIEAPRLIHLVDGQITTSVESGTGGGGNIGIDPQFVILQNSQIIANAFGGPGGNIRIVAGQLIADPATTITASSALGIDGTVNIDAPESDVGAGLAVLPASFLDAASLMQAGCGAARAGLSSLVEVGRGGLPPGPDDYLPSLDLAATAAPGPRQAGGDRQSTRMLAFVRTSQCQP